MISKKHKNKLDFEGLFVQVPVNAKALLSQNERDFLDTLIHLQNPKKQFVSDSVIIANSGLSKNQLTTAKYNLITLGLIKIKYVDSKRGTLYSIDHERYKALISTLNRIGSPAERFSTGDAIRTERGLKPIFHNIVNTLKRLFKALPNLEESEMIYAMAASKEHSTTKNLQLRQLEIEYEDGQILWDVYNKRKKIITSK